MSTQPTIPTRQKIWNRVQFLGETGKTVPGSVGQIMEALDTYHNNPSDPVNHLFVVLAECDHWLKKFKKKLLPNKRELRTQAAVYRLKVDVEAALQRYNDANERYNRKITKSNNLKSLQPGYHLERESFKTSGKKVPYSVTSLSSTQNKEIKDLGGLENLSLENYETLGAQKGVLRMYFCKRKERLKLLVEYTDKGWVNILGDQLSIDIHYKTSIGHPWECQMWAMDRYGNLFVAWDNREYAKRVLGVKSDKAAVEARGGMMNHSSFCAGRDVICAGMIYFHKGQMVHIDNLSGHYAPTRENLKQAVKILVNEYYGGPGDTACSYLRVGLFEKIDNVDQMTVYSAREFLKNAIDGDWPEQDLKDEDHTEIYAGITGFHL